MIYCLYFCWAVNDVNCLELCFSQSCDESCVSALQLLQKGYKKKPNYDYEEYFLRLNHAFNKYYIPLL